MNPRVLELLKNPKNIQPEDIGLLRGEIDVFPYIQNIRALHLYGVHLYEKENYQKELSTTAAYTTDKKILYQLINGKIQQKPKPKIQEPVVQEGKIEEDLKNTHKQSFYQSSSFPLKRENDAPNDNDDTSCSLQSASQEVTYVYVNGERNRILFEGEENSATEEKEKMITLTSDSLIQQNNEVSQEIKEFEPETIVEEETITSEPAKEEILEDSELSFHEAESLIPIEESEMVIDEVTEVNEVAETAEFTPEKIINEDKISSETENIQDKEELSFHGMESFLPEVKIQINNSEEAVTEISQPNLNKHEDEMRRLIEVVEKKMKEKEALEKLKEEEPEHISHEISFAETQSFEMIPVASPVEEVAKPEKIIAEAQPEVIDMVEPEKENAEELTEVKSAWRPMSLESNLPDSLLNKTVEAPISKIAETTKQEDVLPTIEQVSEEIEDQSEPIEEKPVEELKTEEKVTEKTEENKEDVPVMNVSFFSSNWTIAQSEKEAQSKEEIQEEKVEETLIEAPKKNLIDSNVPGFINTWQSWLKIDRVEEVEKEKAEIKTKVIESFIENNPKISQLRDESSYVVKERNDDISHLMTETLATLYFEQKLYTKAIKAFGLLIDKNPEKEEYFKAKIQEIKDFRSKN
jgi:hypothetical protein